jgi:hypothetical protein
MGVCVLTNEPRSHPISPEFVSTWYQIDPFGEMLWFRTSYRSPSFAYPTTGALKSADSLITRPFRELTVMKKVVG